MKNTTAKIIENTSGMSDEAALDLLQRTGVDLEYGNLRFTVEQRNIDDALTTVVLMGGDRLGVKENIIKCLKRFEKRLATHKPKKKEWDDAAADIILLHAINQLDVDDAEEVMHCD
jgi:hypothetical protein